MRSISVDQPCLEIILWLQWRQNPGKLASLLRKRPLVDSETCSSRPLVTDSDVGNSCNDTYHCYHRRVCIGTQEVCDCCQRCDWTWLIYEYAFVVGCIDSAVLKTKTITLDCPCLKCHNQFAWFVLPSVILRGSVEWLACRIQAQKGLGSNCSRDTVG